MERLTKVMTCPDGTKLYDISNKLLGLDASMAKKTRMILEKLATYEDAEEQGLLFRLSCKVGDIVYAPTRNFVSELRIILISVEKNSVFFHWMLNTGIYPKLDGFNDFDIGKTVFLTREDAEAKLKEMI